MITASNLPHILCALLLVARLGDIGTTWLATPKLLLEGNPIVRKLGWPYAWLTVVVCLLPYVSEPVAVVALVLSLLAAAGNAGRMWVMISLGEQAYADFLIQAARRSKLSYALGCVWAGAFFFGLVGVTILMLSSPSTLPGNCSDGWGEFIGAGVLIYAAAVWVYGTLSVVRLFRRVGKRGVS
jgi:hypothetical protein